MVFFFSLFFDLFHVVFAVPVQIISFELHSRYIIDLLSVPVVSVYIHVLHPLVCCVYMRYDLQGNYLGIVLSSQYALVFSRTFINMQLIERYHWDNIYILFIMIQFNRFLPPPHSIYAVLQDSHITLAHHIA